MFNLLGKECNTRLLSLFYIFNNIAGGFLTRINKDQLICGWCYIFRCAVPCLATGAIVLFSPPPSRRNLQRSS